MKKLINHIIETSKKQRVKPEVIFNQFIEMTYQLTCTSTYHRDFSSLEKEHFKFTQLLEELITKNPFSDVIGEIMLDVFSFDKKNLGQCMTPPDISSLGEKIQGRYLVEKMNHKKELDISDVCGCGTGSLILELLKVTINSKAKIINIVINDIDETMVKISVIQIRFNLSIHNKKKKKKKAKIVSLTAYCGNTLTDYNKPENLVFFPNPHLISEPYVKGYFEHQELQNNLMNLLAITNRFEELPLNTNVTNRRKL